MTGTRWILAGGLTVFALVLAAGHSLRGQAELVSTSEALSDTDIAQQASIDSERREPNSNGFIIPTMSFDTRAPDHAKLSRIDPGLPIKDYFDDFFPYSCPSGVFGREHDTKGWIATRFRDDIDMELSGHNACGRQVSVICDQPTDGSKSSWKAAAVNQGILLRILTDDLRLTCGLVTSAHAWASVQNTDGSLARCATFQGTAQQSVEIVDKVSRAMGQTVPMPVQDVTRAKRPFQGKDVSMLGTLLGSSNEEASFYYERFSRSRVALILDSLNSGLFGTTGALSTDLEFEPLNLKHCSKLDNLIYTDIYEGRLARFEDIRALNSVSALRATCDQGVMICASPPVGQAADQKRCSHYLPEELGAEGDVYDFRTLVNGKGIVRHYGTSFKGLSGAGHYCLRSESEPIPFGMSAAVFSNPVGVDRETYNKWLELYIMQGSRERGEYGVVQHLANLADFEDFRKRVGMD